MTTAWTAEHVRQITPGAGALIPPITAPCRSRLDPARLYWDMWPVQDVHGQPATIAGRALWMALAAPDRGDPAQRHFEAKIHLIERSGKVWLDLGSVLPDFVVPYEREWAGSALFDGGVFTLFFTAAGISTRVGGYQQQLWQASAPVGVDGLPGAWSFPTPCFDNYGADYMPADAHDGAPGMIKAFRDPAYFRDPADGTEYLAFTASLGRSDNAYNGAFGLARRDASGWVLTPPCLHADGVNNELERAHLVFHGEHYYAFWSTQTGTFAPELRQAPGGLYGMVATSMRGPWKPLNGTGLVLANPADRPLQTYSWFVDASLTVCSFVDMLPDGEFGGVPAPLLQLELDGDRAAMRVVQSQGGA